MKLSAKRQKELERLLRKLRQQAFTCDRSAALIPKVKARLMPAWNARHDAVMEKRMRAYFM
jgi:hypothetical protein